MKPTVTVREASRRAARARRLWAAGKRQEAHTALKGAYADLQEIRRQETEAFVERMHEVCATLEDVRATLDRMLEDQRGVLARTEGEGDE